MLLLEQRKESEKMENKVGYAYISLEDYKQLIERIKTLEFCYDELREKNKRILKEYENIEKTISERIYNSNSYQIESYDGIGEYYHNKIVREFQSYGYISLDKINELIQKLVEKYKNEEGNEKENE